MEFERCYLEPTDAAVLAALDQAPLAVFESVLARVAEQVKALPEEALRTNRDYRGSWHIDELYQRPIPARIALMDYFRSTKRRSRLRTLPGVANVMVDTAYGPYGRYVLLMSMPVAQVLLATARARLEEDI